MYFGHLTIIKDSAMDTPGCALVCAYTPTTNEMQHGAKLNPLGSEKDENDIQGDTDETLLKYKIVVMTINTWKKEAYLATKNTLPWGLREQGGEFSASKGCIRSVCFLSLLNAKKEEPQ